MAFAGRSNVGKSSLINALTGRRSLARVSRTPGRTQQINVFNLGGRLTLVDLPGYGYARAPRSRTEAWTRLVESYIANRAGLRRVCLLVDSRHGVKPNDEDVMALLDAAAVSYQVVMTKCDKITDPESAAEDLGTAIAGYPCAHPEVRTTSVQTGHGIPALRAALAGLASPLKLG